MAKMQAIDAGELKVPQLNVFAHAVRGEDDKVVGLVAANQLRQERGTTQAQRRGVSTVRMEDEERDAMQRRLPQGLTAP